MTPARSGTLVESVPARRAPPGARRRRLVELVWGVSAEAGGDLLQGECSLVVRDDHGPAHGHAQPGLAAAELPVSSLTPSLQQDGKCS